MEKEDAGWSSRHLRCERIACLRFSPAVPLCIGAISKCHICCRLSLCMCSSFQTQFLNGGSGLLRCQRVAVATQEFRRNGILRPF